MICSFVTRFRVIASTISPRGWLHYRVVGQAPPSPVFYSPQRAEAPPGRDSREEQSAFLAKTVLDRSERTVRRHAVSVYRKSGLAGRAELLAFFLEDLLLPMDHEGEQEQQGARESEVEIEDAKIALSGGHPKARGH
jgi:hypothetical protein